MWLRPHVPIKCARWRSQPTLLPRFCPMSRACRSSVIRIAATPAPIIARLRPQLDTLLASRDFAERMRQVGIQIQRMRLDAFDAFAQQERLRWAKLIESLKLQIE